MTTAAVGFEAVLASARARTNVQHLAWGLFLTARSALAADRAEEAVASLAEARPLLPPMADRPSLAIAEGLLAAASVRAPDAGAASAVHAGILPRLSARRDAAPTLLRRLSRRRRGGRRSLKRAPIGENGERAHDARRAVRALERFARLFPLARPAAHRLRAAILSAQGRAPAAAAELRASGELADRLGMKLEAVAARRTDPAQP